MSGLFLPLLFLHVLGAIVALGPPFAFPLIGSMAAREPQHANFATRVSALIDDRITRPVVLLTGATGIAMIWSRSLPLLDAAYRWLLLAIVIYAVALGLSLFVQRPAVRRVIELTKGPGAPGPELGAATTRVGRGGIVLTFLAFALVFLMVVKPSLGA